MLCKDTESDITHGKGKIRLQIAPKVVVVTGAAHGIGETLVWKFGHQGSLVVAVDQDAKVLQVAQSVEESGCQAVGRVADLCEASEIESLVQEIDHRFGRLDVLVNNAARQTPGSITELPISEWDAVHAVCLRAPFVLMKHAIPIMTRRGSGVIINIASIHGLVAYRAHPAYDSAKAGLIALTRQAALEYSGFGIRTIAISPGFVQEDNPNNHPKSPMFPVGRTGTPDDIADLVIFLCSSRAGFINGSNIVIDGGLTAISPAVYWEKTSSLS